MDLVGPIIGTLSGLCDCVVTIAIIAGAIWFFVLRNKGGADLGVAAANDLNKSFDSGHTPSTAFDSDEEDDVATVVAPQPSALADKPNPNPKPMRPPRSAGATIIAFDDDDLLDD